jgi:hypothetical protein
MPWVKIPPLPSDSSTTTTNKNLKKNKIVSAVGSRFTYQKGPETPYAQATFEDWRRVAAQVH